MRKRFVMVAVLMFAALAVGAANLQAQCVPFTQVVDGHFFYGWKTDTRTATLDGQAAEFEPTPNLNPKDYGVELPPAPVDHGWSTHSLEATRPRLMVDGQEVGAYVQITRFVATVDSTVPAFTGDRRDIPAFTLYRVNFDYKGEGLLADGVGAFEGATGHFVTRGKFWLDFLRLPNGADVPAQVLGIPDTGGEFSFETKGMICGASLDAPGLR